jgi:hypothetical protein
LIFNKFSDWFMQSNETIKQKWLKKYELKVTV